MRPMRYQQLVEGVLPSADDEVLFGATDRMAYWQIATGIRAGDEYWRTYHRDVAAGVIPQWPRPAFVGRCVERGHILIELIRGKWYVTDVKTFERGYGPLLYDIAMEYATMHGGGLNPHSAAGIFNAHTTAPAQRIWSYYRDNRPDVQYGPDGVTKAARILPLLRHSNLIVDAPFQQNWMS